MTNKESSKEENPLIYYAIIILAIGLVAYKWLSAIDKTTLIHDVVQIVLALTIIIWFFATIIFGIRGYMLKEDKSKKIFKILIHLANLLIVATFIYRLTLIIFFDYSLLIHGILALTIILYYNFIIHWKIFKNNSTKEIRRTKINKEQEEIITFINTKLENLSIKELKEKKEYYKWKIYTTESITPFLESFRKQLSELDFVIEKKEKKEELEELLQKKDAAKNELEKIQKKKQEELMDKESEKAHIMYRLTHDKEENVIVQKGLRGIEKEAILSAGYKQVNEYCIYEKKIITVFVKPIMDHSPTHTFLVWSTTRLLEEFKIENIETHDTKDADITFTHNNKKYAIEIETGNLLKKMRRLEEKVAYLNRKYHHRWFFIVSNRNLQAKYKKYGISTQRIRVWQLLEKMLENTHPKKAGVNTKSSTKDIQKKSLK